MLPTGRSVAEQIFACDEGVMGYHNDRRASGKMPANGRWKVTFFILSTSFLLFQESLTRACVIINYISLAYLERFSPCSSVVYLKYTPSSHDENLFKLCDPVGNIYY